MSVKRKTTWTALAFSGVAAARRNGLAVDETIARAQVQAAASNVENWRERGLQFVPIPGDAATASYWLVGLAAEDYPPEPATDALARYLKNRQSEDGRLWSPTHRPPSEASDFQSANGSHPGPNDFGRQSPHSPVSKRHNASESRPKWGAGPAPSHPLVRQLSRQDVTACVTKRQSLRQPTATQNATHVQDALESDLAIVVSAWGSLPAALKAGIVAMVQAAEVDGERVV